MNAIKQLTNIDPFKCNALRVKLQESFVPVTDDATYTHNLEHRVQFLNQVFAEYDVDGLDYTDYVEYMLELNIYKMFAFEADGIIKKMKEVSNV